MFPASWPLASLAAFNRFDLRLDKLDDEPGKDDSSCTLGAAGPRPNADSAAHAVVLVGEAKAYAEDISVEITSELFALLGTSAADESLNLDRHWRIARVYSIHDASQWRYHGAGNWFLNGIASGKPVRRLAAPDGTPTP